MKNINPIGREVCTGTEAHYDLRACMCSQEFGAARDELGADDCMHCGCDCNGNYNYNRNEASTTVRTS